VETTPMLECPFPCADGGAGVALVAERVELASTARPATAVAAAPAAATSRLARSLDCEDWFIWISLGVRTS
jgi:hypothetical protein